jgi:hypothetical protein
MRTNLIIQSFDNYAYMSLSDVVSGGLIFLVALYSVKVAPEVRQGGSETAAVRGAVLTP